MRPGYLPVPLPSTLANDRGYALFLYREGMSRVSSGDARREVGRLGKPRPDGTRATPAIFLPGNGGSFKQVRSVGSESHRISGERARGRDATRQKNDDSNANANVSDEPIPYLDWFAVSFGEELSAFHGALLEDQIAFAARAIEHVASLYAVQRRTAHGHLPTGESHTGRISSVPTHVAILGHSMGGLVARGALLDARFRVEKKSAPPLAFSLVTLASPHAYSPATTTKGAARTHARMNEAWRVGHAAARGDASLRHVALASVAGGDRDRQVLASHASVVGVVDARFGFEVDAGDVPTARGVSADHQCVVWCNQVIKAVANALIDAVMSHTRDYEADEPPPSEGGAEKRFSEAEASYEATASYDAIATATAARRAALASRLVGDISDTRTTGDENSRRSLVTVRRVLARGALRWTPSLVPATVSAAFALAGAASPRRAARAGEGSSGKRPFFYTRRGTHAWDMCDTQALVFAGAGTLASCLACAWLPAAGAAAGAAARVVLLCRLVNQSRTKKKKRRPFFSRARDVPLRRARRRRARHASLRGGGGALRVARGGHSRGDEGANVRFVRVAFPARRRGRVVGAGGGGARVARARDGFRFRERDTGGGGSPGGRAGLGGSVRRRRGGGGRGRPGARARDADRRRARGRRRGGRGARRTAGFFFSENHPTTRRGRGEDEDRVMRERARVARHRSGAFGSSARVFALALFGSHT